MEQKKSQKKSQIKKIIGSTIIIHANINISRIVKTILIQQVKEINVNLYARENRAQK